MAARGTGTSKAASAAATALKTKASLLAWAKVESRMGEQLAAACGWHVEVDSRSDLEPAAAGCRPRRCGGRPTAREQDDR